MSNSELPIQTPPMLSGGLPLLGHLIEFGKDRGKLFHRGYQEHGKAFSFKIGPKRAVVLIGPEYQKEFYQQTDKSLDMASAYYFLKPLFGDVFFIADHATYLNQRPLMMEPFQRSKMDRYVRIIQQVVQKWLDSLGDEGQFEVSSSMDQLVKEVAGRTFFGENFQDELGEEFWRNYIVLSKALDPVIPPNLPLPKFIRRNKARKRIHRTLKAIIQQRRSQPEKYDDFLQDFLNKPCTDGTMASEEDVIGMLMALLFAGHETTVGQAAWTLVQLLQHPDYLQKAQAEIEESWIPGEKLDPKILRQWKLQFYAVDESSRMHPSADINVRTPDEDITLGDYRIPGGVPIFTAAEVAQFLPEVFQDPQNYDPMRFAPDRREDKNCPFSIISFGGGVHKCTGMNFARNEMAIIPALLFSQFDCQLLGTAPHTTRKLGANRPSETWIAYRRKQKLPQRQHAAAITSGCPFHEGKIPQEAHSV